MQRSLPIFALLAATSLLPACAQAQPGKPVSATMAESAAIPLRLSQTLSLDPLPHGKLHYEPTPATSEDSDDAASSACAPASAYWSFALGLVLGIFLCLALFFPELSSLESRRDPE